MSSTSALSAGVQQLYNDGLIPSSLSTSTTQGASANQLNQIAGLTIASQESAALFGTGSDSASLSSTATNALLQEINPTNTSSTTSSTTDPLTAAVNSALTAKLNAAVNQFEPSASTTTGSNINVVG